MISPTLNTSEPVYTILVVEVEEIAVCNVHPESLPFPNLKSIGLSFVSTISNKLPSQFISFTLRG